MQIDLNQPFTSDDVKELLASKDDSQHRQLRVEVTDELKIMLSSVSLR